MGGCKDDWLAALLLEERCGGGLQNEFGALNALVLVTLREKKTEARSRYSGEGGDNAREMDQVPEVRDRNRGVRQMERGRRNRSRKQNMSKDHRETGRMRGAGEKKKDVSILVRPEGHTKKAFHRAQ